MRQATAHDDRELLHFQSGCTVYVLALRVELEYLGGMLGTGVILLDRGPARHGICCCVAIS